MKHKKFIVASVILLAIGFIVIALSNSTYALFSSDAYGTNTDIYTTGMLLVKASSKSETISLDNALPMSDEDGLDTNPYVFTIKNIGNLDYLFDVKLLSTGDSNTIFSPQYIKLQIDDGDVITLSSLTNGEIKSDITLLAGESIDISIRAWLSIETPNSEIGKSFNSKIVTDGQAVYTSSNDEYKSLVNHISNLYNNASKTVITNAVVTNKIIKYNQANIYNIDDDDTTSGGLMNDRLGATTADYDAGNIRYYGKNPSNYVDIGDTEIDSNGNEITTLYRIIGLFKDITVINDDGTTETKDLVKVIRNDSIGGYAWDNKSNGIGTATNTSGYGSNNWADARLMMLLNPGYENGLIAEDGDVIYGYPGSLYWNSENGTCYSGRSNATTSCDFKTKKTGLSTTAQEKIEKVVWNLRGSSSTSAYSNQMYNYERTTGSVFNASRATEWEGKVALMYASDYGYATDLSDTVCSTHINNYRTSDNSYGCRANDWLYLGGLTNHWMLSLDSSSAYAVWYIKYDANIYRENPSVANQVRPVFYLDSDLAIESGSGTKTDPYVLA